MHEDVHHDPVGGDHPARGREAEVPRGSQRSTGTNQRCNFSTGEGESSSPRRQRTIADIAQPRVEGLRINSNLNEGDVLRQTVLDRMVWTQ